MPIPFSEVLPHRVVDLMTKASFAQYASVSAANVPIDTPVLIFPGEGMRSIDLATGLSYPAKAERARRNPRVGLYIEGGPDDPVVSIAGMAAVRDADLQANADRYLSEAAHSLAHDPDWSLARQAVWYWTRILVEITPAQVVWWERPTAMDSAPNVWTAPGDTIFPQSDLAAPGKVSKAAKWEERPWRELAVKALGRNVPGYVSVLDQHGYPRPVRVWSHAITDAGFVLRTPIGTPWKIAGKACLTFGGIETFIGDIAAGLDGSLAMTVERTLPMLPMTEDMVQLWEPTDDTRSQLMRRLEEETTRRGQSIPVIPHDRPEPSKNYRKRIAWRQVMSQQ